MTDDYLLDDDPQLVEKRSDSAGDYEVHWLCEPPADGEAYYVDPGDDSWNDECTVRQIKAWRPQ